MTEAVRRDATDRCPGVFSTHAAADGAVARVRLPGGRIRPAQLELLAQAATAHGDGYLELTARANLQLRGLTDVDAVADAVVEAGLAPSSTHDKVRNIEVSALTGRIGGIADVRPLADLLDDRLQAAEVSAALSGRFLFGLDDGRGDIARREPDACAIVRSADGSGEIVVDVLVGGTALGSARGDDAISAELLAVATDMIAICPGAWRVSDLTEAQRTELDDRVRARLAPAVGGPDPGPADPIVGWFDQDDGRVLLGAVVELGRLPARLAEFVAAVQAPIVVTPDREILICDLDEGVAETVVRVLAPMGLIFDAGSPWATVSCCVGAPGCAKSLAPVREDLLVRIRDGEPVTEREHWVGCGRRCGSPSGPHRSVEATPDGGYVTHRR
ncbi:precorrin-3B synthase [Gordonia sp. SL306]|uniref:precorrin-3B synthase n=1 Tax=Gordonia sp. SL306 TaxID=2995145 RepID=UPI00226FFBBF|nr:precorrin-3B synthase [Gordonia sp. SL306]WAC55441.1 precorrin-3B synthase [Gordonia sp. SL306]